MYEFFKLIPADRSPMKQTYNIDDGFDELR